MSLEQGDPENVERVILENQLLPRERVDAVHQDLYHDSRRGNRKGGKYNN